MLYTISGVTLLLLLAVAVLPVPHVRRWLLTALARIGQATVLAVLGACGTFFVQPRAAPEWLTTTATPLLEDALGISLDAGSGWPWLILAVLAVGISLPVLMAVELGLGFAAQTVQVQGLRKEIRQAAAWVDNRLAALGLSRSGYPALPNEALAATEALRSAGHADNQHSSASAPLVIDLIK